MLVAELSHPPLTESVVVEDADARIGHIGRLVDTFAVR